MPQIPLIQPSGLIEQQPVDPSLIRESRYAAGAIDNLGRTIVTGLDDDQKAQDAVAAQQQRSEGILAVTRAVGQEHVTSLQAQQDAANSGGMAGFTSQWSKDFDQRTEDGAAAIPQDPQAQQLYRLRMAELKSSLSERFYGQEMGARNLALATGARDGIDSAAQSAYLDPSSATGSLAQWRSAVTNLDIPPEDKQRLLDALPGVAFAAAAKRVETNPQVMLSTLGNADAVRADPVLSQLGAKNLETLTGHAQSLVAQQENAAQRMADAADKVGNDTYNALVDFVNSGRSPDLNYATEVQRATAGTKWAPLVQQLLDMSARAAGFGSQSLPRQQQTLAQLEAQLSAGSNPDEERMLASLRTIASNQQGAFKADPLQAFTQFAKGPPMLPEQLSSVTQGLELVQSRMSILPAIEAYGGVQGVSPLHPQEVQQLGQLIRALPADQAATALSDLGGLLGTTDRVTAAARQFGDSDGVLGLAMAFAADRWARGGMFRSDDWKDGPLVGQMVLAGDQAIKDKQIDEATLRQWRQDISAAVRGAYPVPQAEDAAIEGALRVAAYLQNRNISSSDTDAAVRAVTGGVITHGAGRTVLPRGMSEDQFDEALGAITASSLADQAPDAVVHAGHTAIPLSTFARQLSNATLQVQADGRYVVRAGNSIVSNSFGRPIVLDVRAATAGATAPAQAGP